MRGFLAGAGTVWIVTKILDIYDKLSESEKKEVGSRETLEKELRA